MGVGPEQEQPLPKLPQARSTGKEEAVHAGALKPEYLSLGARAYLGTSAGLRN